VRPFNKIRPSLLTDFEQVEPGTEAEVIESDTFLEKAQTLSEDQPSRPPIGCNGQIKKILMNPPKIC
jgi:hypothetical protein